MSTGIEEGEHIVIVIVWIFKLAIMEKLFFIQLVHVANTFLSPLHTYGFKEEHKQAYNNNCSPENKDVARSKCTTYYANNNILGVSQRHADRQTD